MGDRFILPLSVTLPRKTKKDKKLMLNKNVFRNLHYQLINQVKQQFQPISMSIEMRLEDNTFSMRPIKIDYIVEKRTKRKFDTMNIITEVDKCFLDWLVGASYIRDDTFDYVSYGSITGKNDCEHDRVIATIERMKGFEEIK